MADVNGGGTEWLKFVDPFRCLLAASSSQEVLADLA